MKNSSNEDILATPEKVMLMVPSASLRTAIARCLRPDSHWNAPSIGPLITTVIITTELVNATGALQHPTVITIDQIQLRS